MDNDNNNNNNKRSTFIPMKSGPIPRQKQSTKEGN